MSDFKWTNEKVKMFTQIYSSNFQSKGLDENIFSYGNYHGKSIDEKMAQFKRDCLHIQFKKGKTDCSVCGGNGWFVESSGGKTQTLDCDCT